MSTRRDDVELQPLTQEELDTMYKPWFGEDEAISLKELKARITSDETKEKMREMGITMHISSSKLDELLTSADVDADKKLDYNEFVTFMRRDDHDKLTREKLSVFKLVVRSAVSSVVPKSAKSVQGEDLVEDYMSHYNCKPPPLFMTLISLAEVAVFIYYAYELRDDPIHHVTMTTGVPMYSPLIFNPSRRYEAWRYLTYMFIHQGYSHIISNLIFQLLIGLPLEMVHKWWRVGIVYLCGVIAGCLCHTIFDSCSMLAGASGGCYALIGAHFAIIITNWKEMTHDWMAGPCRFLMSAPVRLLCWSLFAALDIGLAVYKRYTSTEGNIGYAAHLGGAVAGLLLGIPVLKNLDVERWEFIIAMLCIIAYLVFIIFAVLWNYFYEGFPEKDSSDCCGMPIISCP